MARLAAIRTAGGGQLYVGDKGTATGILDCELHVLPFLSFFVRGRGCFFFFFYRVVYVGHV